MKTTNSLFKILAITVTLAAVRTHADCTPPPAGIVGWWKGDGNTIDSISSNNGVAVNVTYTTGVVGQAFAFNSVDYGPYVGVQVPDRPAYALTNSLTIEGWVRPRGDGWFIFWRGDNRPGLDPYSLGMQHNNTVRFAITDTNGNYAIAETTLAYNQWTHLAATLNGASGTMSIYTNGVLAVQTVTSVRPFGALIAGDSPGVGVGNLNDGQNIFGFIGDIDEISLYNRALSSSEIGAIYNAGNSGKCVPTPVSTSEPAIINFSPTSGSTGVVVTIIGTNFSAVAASNVVYFGAVRATVTAASVTNLTVTVPKGATYAPITETVNGLIAYSGQPFLPAFNGSGQINSSSFGSPLILPTGTGPGQVAVDDLDGDGKPDLVIADSYAGDISIYQNIGTNSSLAFASRLVLPMIKGAYGNPATVVVADLDGDGKPDVIALNSDSGFISIFRNVSSPGILTTNSFAPRIDIPAPTGMQDLAVRDLNSDGRSDIVTANGASNSFSIYQNQSTIGNISFAAPVNLAVGSYAADVAIADLDGDGIPDLTVLLMNNNSVLVFRNLGLGGTLTTNSFAPLVIFPSGANGRFLSIGDMDGDGKPDIVTANWTAETISVLRNLTSGPGITSNSFASPVSFATGGWANNLTLGNLGGIGKLDVVAVSQAPSLFSIFQNVSTPGGFTTGSLAPRVDYTSGYNPNSATIADLNGDGRSDIVIANQYDNNIYILANNVPTATPPMITNQPQDAYVHAYDVASFSVTATGATGYHWLFNGSNILNAISSTFTITSAEQSDVGQYSVVVANNYGAVTSSIANLYMYPSLVSPFAGVVTDWGQPTTLSVTAWGSGILTYQWYDNGIIIPNATNSTLTFSAIQFTNAGSYSVVVSSSLGSVTNTAAQVVVNPAGVSLGLYPGLTITGTVGYTYNIQSNPDLTNPNGWTTVATITLWQPTQFWVDVNSNAASPTNQHRFYRVLPVP
jgi:hypothetical protein